MFPFQIQNFHSDNRGEFINHKVAKLLNKLLTSQTKSRPRYSNDNGLAETKNASIIRKHIGHLHISPKYAPSIIKFYLDHLIPSRYQILNFYRPSAFQKKILLSSKGKIKTVSPHKGYQTPFQKLFSLKNPEQHLRIGYDSPKTRETSPQEKP